jgi:hypothetical protein
MNMRCLKLIIALLMLFNISYAKEDLTFLQGPQYDCTNLLNDLKNFQDNYKLSDLEKPALDDCASLWSNIVCWIDANFLEFSVKFTDLTCTYDKEENCGMQGCFTFYYYNGHTTNENNLEFKVQFKYTVDDKYSGVAEYQV